jgi:hypothetical protein
MAAKKHNPAVTAQSEQRRARAVKLRVAGHTYESIARICGYASKSGAFDAVQGTLAEEKSEAVEDLRKVESARLDKLLRVYAKLAGQGDTQAAQVVLGITKERAKLHGLYAPVETKLSGGFGVTLDAIDEARAAAAANDPECSTPPPSPTSPDDTSTSAPDSSPGD